MEQEQEKTQGRKVVHLEIGGNHYYFGSIEQLYDDFSKEELGICRSTVKCKLKKERVIVTDKCTIRQGFLKSKAHRNKD